MDEIFILLLNVRLYLHPFDMQNHLHSSFKMSSSTTMARSVLHLHILKCHASTMELDGIKMYFIFLNQPTQEIIQDIHLGNA